jgi:hypothetical protein
VSRRSIQQAACDALGAYLQAEFDKVYDSEVESERVQVLPNWPEASVQLPPRAVSVIMAGDRKESPISEELIRKVSDLPDNQGLYEWAIKCVTQPIQIDIWTHYDEHRDLIEDDLDTILHRGPAYTLGIANGDIFRDGVLVRLDPTSGHEGTVDYSTITGPRKVTNPGAVEVNEFRSLITAELDVELTLKAASPKLVRVLLQQQLNGTPANFTLQKDGDAFRIASAQL